MSAKKLNVRLILPAYPNSMETDLMAMPLGAGYMAGYAIQEFGENLEINIHVDPEELLSCIRSEPADIIGISVFSWTRNIAIWIAKRIKQIDPACIIVVGGPCVDSLEQTQRELFEEFNGNVDILVPGEGEVALANILRRFQKSDCIRLFDAPIDGCIFMRDGIIVPGKKMNLGAETPLNSIPSPILTGLMDKFFRLDVYPAIQTSRHCPYQCTFCVSGKNIGKLRTRDLDTVEREIRYIANAFHHEPYKPLYIIDENFGINKQDLQIAKIIVEISNEVGWPKKIMVYMNKKFNETTSGIIRTFGDMSEYGYWVPFQSINESTLKAIKRKNIRESEIDKILAHARAEGVSVAADLIYGLPLETKNTFLEAIEFCYERDIMPNIVSLDMFRGMALWRESERKAYKFVVKYREPSEPYYGYFDNDFVYEYDECVCSSSTSSFDDFIEMRKIAFASYAVLKIGHYQLVGKFLSELGIPITQFLSSIMRENNKGPALTPRQCFLSDFNDRITSELKTIPEEVGADIEERLRSSSAKPESTRINTIFASRLIYVETWFTDWVISTYKDRVGDNYQVLEDLCLISANEWIDLTRPRNTKNINISNATANYLSQKSYFDNISGSQYNAKKQKTIDFEASISAVDAMERLGERYKSFDEFALRAVQFLGAGASLKLSPKKMTDSRSAAA